MPRSLRAVVYGPEYEQLLLLAFTSEAELRFTFPSHSLACSMKSKVYGYWKALRTENLRPDLVAKAELMSMKTDGSDLVLYRRADAWDARLLRGAMGLEKGFADALGTGILVAKSPTDELVEKLHALRASKTTP